MEDKAGEASLSAAMWLVLALLVLVPALAVLVRSRRHRATARREVLRLVQMITEESELAEQESMLIYYSDLGMGMTETMKGYGGESNLRLGKKARVGLIVAT
jgi:uncharacterized membrane protein YhaH (DUF805 family)